MVQSCRRLRDQNVAEFGASPKVYSRAARKGEPTALFEYGLLLIDGEGGPKNPARGRRLVERAAANGNINALRVLAAAYDEGLLTFKRSHQEQSEGSEHWLSRKLLVDSPWRRAMIQ